MIYRDVLLISYNFETHCITFYDAQGFGVI
jgi:hypothetical protein